MPPAVANVVVLRTIKLRTLYEMGIMAFSSTHAPEGFDHLQ